ncbi:MAG: glycosyltransferase [Planctomycetota bacterium]
MKFSVIIPARNEEVLLGRCLESVTRAAAAFPGQVEVVVVINRCTDRTEAIARDRGARIVRDDSRVLSRIRNAGARAARGEILVTIDADSRMAGNTFAEIDRAMASGRYIGGGAVVRPERRSLGIFLSEMVLWAGLLATGLSGGLFWCRRGDFEAVGGFDERLIVAEDLDFARRLKIHGRRGGRRFGTLWRSPVSTSCRKFDRFGDWVLFRMLVLHPRQLWRALRGTDRTFADRFFYDFPR